MAVATADAFRTIRVVQPTTPEATITTVAAEVVGDTLSITAGLGITITANPDTDTLVISNTGNGTGAYTEITDTNANSTFYPLFSRPFEPTDINPLDTPPSYQLDAIYVDNTANPMTYNPSSGTLSAVAFVGGLTGDVTGNVSGNAGTVTNGVYTSGSYSDPSWLTISQSFVGLGNVTNESKATMFSSPTFTGTVAGVTATMVGLGNVTNESKATMFTDPTFTGTVAGVTATMVGLGNVTNESKATMFSSPTFTGTVDLSSIQTSATNITIQTSTTFGDPGFTRGKIELSNNGYNDYIVPNTGYTHRFYVGSNLVLAMPSNNGTLGDALTTDGDGFASWTTITATTVGLGNVTNESKATMFTDPTFTGTVAGVTSTHVGLGNVENTALSTSTHYIGTTSITYNRASASQTLTGVSVDGSAGSVANALTISTGLSLSSGTTYDGSAALTLTIDSTVTTLTGTETLTNKRITQRVPSAGTTSGTLTPTGDASDIFSMTGLTGSVTVAIPSGTPTDGQRLMLRFKDNGTARSISWTTSAGGYRAFGFVLPGTTVVNKWLYVGCIYNAVDAYWDVISYSQQ